MHPLVNLAEELSNQEELTRCDIPDEFGQSGSTGGVGEAESTTEMEEEQPILRILKARLNPPPTHDPEALSRIISGVAREIFLEGKFAETRICRKPYPDVNRHHNMSPAITRCKQP
jgi:hypothetical protein